MIPPTIEPAKRFWSEKAAWQYDPIRNDVQRTTWDISILAVYCGIGKQHRYFLNLGMGISLSLKCSGTIQILFKMFMLCFDVLFGIPFIFHVILLSEGKFHYSCSISLQSYNIQKMCFASAQGKHWGKFKC